MKILNYTQELTEYTKILISDDLERVVLANVMENFMMLQIDGRTIQKGLPHLNNKVCRYIGYDETLKEFLFISSHNYDDSLKI